MSENKKKIKVLESLNSLGMGGNVIFVMNFFRHINKEEFQIDFVIYDDSKMDFYDEVKAAGSKVHIIKRKYKNNILQLLYQMRQVRLFLKRNDYDVIHCHSCSFTGICRGAVPGFFTRHTKVISHGHNPGTPKNTAIDNMLRGILKSFLSHISDMGFACSNESGSSKYTKKFMNSKKYTVINNAIETNKFHYDPRLREEMRKKYNIQDKFVFGSVGRLEVQKNYLFILDAIKLYTEKNSDFCLFLVGDGSQRKMIEDKIKALGIEDHVILAGKTSQPELFYSAMDVFVLPSIYEGFGFVNIEAQVSGLPCIVSEAVPREIDISGKVEFVKLDAEAWCSAFENAYQNRQAERQTVQTSKYDLVNESKRLEDFYRSLAVNK